MTTEKQNILFICGQNKWRSPTAVEVFKNDQRISVRSAGVGRNSRKLISASDIEWADLILVMENRHKKRIIERFRDMEMPRIESLDIPDDFQFMDKELIELIISGTEYYLTEEKQG